MTHLSPQRYIAARNEEALEAHGDSLLSVGYTGPPKVAEERYTLMLEVIREPTQRVSVLDLGCGLAHMLDHIESHPELKRVDYSGLDISPLYIEAARRRHPGARLMLLDVLDDETSLPHFDYVIVNHLFNWRGDLGWEEMLRYWERMVSVAFDHCTRGIAFNVMSKIVDWERDDLFHLPFDVMSSFVSANLSRHFVIRHDYEAYEYTTYVYRTPTTFLS
jgi:SAM-dependent methyltransferase